MGYRHYFYKVKKADVELVKDKTLKELLEIAKTKYTNVEIEEEDEWLYFNDDNFMNKVEVFEFGKLYWDNTADRIYSKGVPLFANEETQNEFNDYVPYVVGKEGLLEAITIYKENIKANYEGLLKDGGEYCLPFGITMPAPEVTKEQKIDDFIKNRLARLDWIVNTDESKKYCVTGSWTYEHSIFNLVHLLKVIDWETETILFYGW